MWFCVNWISYGYIVCLFDWIPGVLFLPTRPDVTVEEGREASVRATTTATLNKSETSVHLKRTAVR